MNLPHRPRLRLLLDQGFPADAAGLFIKAGYECAHVSEFGMNQARDEDILAFARKNLQLILTLDSDFHAILAVRGLNSPSVVRLRREGCRAEAVFGILEPVL